MPLSWLLANWKLVGLALLVGFAGVQTYRLQGAHARIDQYKAEEQHRREMGSLVQRQQDHTTRKAEAQHEKRIATLRSTVARLRNQRAASSIVPEAPGSGAGIHGDDTAICFARNRLRDGIDRAFAQLRERLAASAERGAGAITTLETCAAWAFDNWHQRAQP